jgi:hypothetical protein
MGFEPRTFFYSANWTIWLSEKVTWNEFLFYHNSNHVQIYCNFVGYVQNPPFKKSFANPN